MRSRVRKKDVAEQNRDRADVPEITTYIEDRARQE